MRNSINPTFTSSKFFMISILQNRLLRFSILPREHYIKLKTGIFFVSLLLIFCCVDTQAQTLYEISGHVTDSSSAEGLPGILVRIKGTNEGMATDANGDFKFRTSSALPFVLEISGSGYLKQELTVKDKSASLVISLHSESILVSEVVISASRVEESTLKTPVSVEKLDVRAIRESSASSFFDAIESLKGVQFTTLSLGFKVPNTRGFGSTTNSRFLQLVDGADNQAPGLGVSIANAAGPSELDIQSVELIPGAASALYGMNALNGLSNLRTRNPFYSQGFGVYQKSGVNHVDVADANASLFTETSLRYAKSYKERFAFKANLTYSQGHDWVANDRTDLNPNANASTNLFGANNPGYDGINIYGDESSDRKTLTLSGKKYVVGRTGYSEKDLVDYSLKNIKFDGGLYFRTKKGIEFSYVYRVGSADNIYQRGNRIRLEDYVVQQHKVELNTKRVTFRSYYTEENTGHSYNLRPLGENLNRAVKADNVWFTDYSNAFNTSLSQGNSIAASHGIARGVADQGRLIPGSPEFEAKRQELIGINNWDKGAALVMKNAFVHSEAQYNFSDSSLFKGLVAGLDERTYIIRPDGNSFINPFHEGANLYFTKFGGFLQYTRTLLNDKLKIVLSTRIDKASYYKPVINPRVAAVYTLKEKHNFRVSLQNGYRYPTLFEGFSYVDNGGVRRIGGLPIMSERDQIFENSYTKLSVDAFSVAVNTDINAGFSQSDAINRNASKLVKSSYSYIKPEQIQSVEIGYKALLYKEHLYIDVDAYFNVYHDFIGQVEVVKPNAGIIGENDSTTYFAYDKTKNKQFRMWTNSIGTVYNHGISAAVSWMFIRKYVLAVNGSYSDISTVSESDALTPAFNTPKFSSNVSIGNRAVFKNIGFNINWHWQNGFEWQSPLADGFISAYHSVDAQFTIRLPKYNGTIKTGATNLLNNRFVQYTGGPRLGGFYYTSVIFEGLFEGKTKN